jgi:ubiquinone/menaquinone biosynthesis C-methylase UbiE
VNAPSTLGAMRLAGMAEYQRYKRELLSGLDGTVLELGAGRGRNFALLPGGVHWIGLEPSAQRHARLTANAVRSGRTDPEILIAPAEAIPLGDATVDAVFATVVLCSVTDQAQCLAEIRRVLKPGRPYLFFEHVASEPGTFTRWMQEKAAPMTRKLDAGCDPSRETWKAVEAAGFADVELRWFSTRGPQTVFRHYIAGRAVTP